MRPALILREIATLFAKVVVVLLLLSVGLKFGLLVFSGMWAAGDGDGNVLAGISYVWRGQGGLLGFFHLASDSKLAASSDPLIAEAAAERLAIKHQCGGANGLIALLQEKRQPLVQVRLMQALASCGSRGAIPIMRRFLRSEGSTMVPVVAAESLGLMKAREAIPDLEAAVAHCSAACEGAAAVALARMGQRNVAYPWAVKVLSAPRPRRDPGSEDAWKRNNAAEVIESLGTLADIPLLEKNRQELGSVSLGQIEAEISIRQGTSPFSHTHAKATRLSHND